MIPLNLSFKSNKTGTQPKFVCCRHHDLTQMSKNQGFEDILFEKNQTNMESVILHYVKEMFYFTSRKVYKTLHMLF